MNGFTGLYFSFITLSTVGYGDIIPVLEVGRIVNTWNVPPDALNCGGCRQSPKPMPKTWPGKNSLDLKVRYSSRGLLLL